MRKRVLIAGFFILLLISLYGALAQDNDTILVPLEETAETSPEEEPVLILVEPEDEPEPELILVEPEEPEAEEAPEEVVAEPFPEEVEEILEEVEEVIEVLPEEPELIEEVPEEPAEKGPSILSRVFNLAKSGVNRARAVGGWVITRDYVSAAKNAVRFVLGLRTIYKILIVIIIIILLIIFWAFYLRDTKSNNLRKARRHHKKGEVAHLKGDEEDAEYHYERAAQFREKAQDQW